MTRAWTAIVLGGALVGIAKVLGQYDLATPIPFLLLLPGILTGASLPGSGFNLKDDTHPWSLLSVFVVYAVNIVLCSGSAYLLLYPFRRHFLTSK
jgi:hypothetical protein